MSEILKISVNLLMYDNLYFQTREEINNYIKNKIGFTATQQTDEQILEKMDISVIERFLRKKKLELLNKK